MYFLTENIEIWPHAVVQMVGSAIRCLDKSLSMFLSSLILIHWSFCQVASKQWRIIRPSPQKLVAAAANERWLFTKQFTYLEGFGVLRRWSVRGTRQAYDQNLPTNALVYSERSDFIILSRALTARGLSQLRNSRLHKSLSSLRSCPLPIIPLSL